MLYFDLNDKIRIDEDSPYNFVSHNSYDSLVEFMTNSVNRIETETSPRIIVLETWLMLDYVIRELIIWGVGVKAISNDEFDLKNELLPIGFKNCLDLLIKLKKQQESLLVDPNKNCIKLPLGFWHYIDTKLEGKEKEIVLKVIYRYQKKKNPNYLTPEEIRSSNEVSSNSIVVNKKLNTIPQNSDFRTVDDHWLNIMKYLDEKWVGRVNQINKARNSAAHSYNEETVFKDFGIKGKDRVEKLRKYCIDTISSLLKIKINT